MKLHFLHTLHIIKSGYRIPCLGWYVYQKNYPISIPWLSHGYPTVNRLKTLILQALPRVIILEKNSRILHHIFLSDSTRNSIFPSPVTRINTEFLYPVMLFMTYHATPILSRFQGLATRKTRLRIRGEMKRHTNKSLQDP